MRVETLSLGALGTNCYLVWGGEAGGEALLIDCAGDPRGILRAAKRNGLRIPVIAITHGHVDHTERLEELKRATGARVAVHALDAPMLSDPAVSGAITLGLPQESSSADWLLREGDVVCLEGTDVGLTVVHTPGHSPGSICLLGEKAVFCGDCLFAGGIGRMDLPGGDEQAMMESLARLMELEPGVVVYPGHGPATTIGEERESNPWLEGL